MNCIFLPIGSIRSASINACFRRVMLDELLPRLNWLITLRVLKQALIDADLIEPMGKKMQFTDPVFARWFKRYIAKQL